MNVAKLGRNWLVPLILTIAASANAADCSPLSQDVPPRIISYLSQRLVSGADKPLAIASIEEVPNTCYHKISLSLPNTTAQTVLYLSPDERFLTPILYDLSADPKTEVAHIASNVEKLLMRDASPHNSAVHERIKLVEFADLQCPYCKLFNEWFAALPDSLRSQTTLVFKHLPLPQHIWARSAAEYTACAWLQNPAAFWQLDNFLMARQSEITPANLKEKILTELSGDARLDQQELQNCAATGKGAAIVDRDIEIAKELAIRSTPTLFVEGRKVITPRSPEELRRLLEVELQDAKPTEPTAKQQSR
jgi:protein-disulfide isomerase